MKQSEFDKLAQLTDSLSTVKQSLDDATAIVAAVSRSLDNISGDFVTYRNSITIDQPGPPPPPPPPTGTGFIQALPGGRVKRADGTPVVLRGPEALYNTSSASAMCSLVKSIGANCISVLFGNTDLTRTKAMLDAAKANNLILLFNPDQGGQRTWALQSATVNLLKQYESTLMLNLETELQPLQENWTASQWAADRIALVTALRNVGYKAPIRIGSPNQGRAPLFAFQVGLQVVAADPLHNVFFSCQEYWGQSYYQGLAGEPQGNAGRIKTIDDFAASPLCFLPGFDLTDDVGDTGESGLCDECQAKGVSYLHWALWSGDDDDLASSVQYTDLTSLGQKMKTRWLSEGH